jgi:hypothetical protein
MKADVLFAGAAWAGDGDARIRRCQQHCRYFGLQLVGALSDAIDPSAMIFEVVIAGEADGIDTDIRHG